MCIGKREDDARKTAHKYFRWSLTGWSVQAELPDTKSFEAASRHVTSENVAEQISCGPSVERHLAAVNKYVAAGFDHIVLTQIGPDQDYFLELFQKETRAGAPSRKRLKLWPCEARAAAISSRAAVPLAGKQKATEEHG